MIRVIPIETGKAPMKTAQMTGREGRSGVGHKIDIFRDANWVAPLPILSFLIEHPESQNDGLPAPASADLVQARLDHA